MKCRVFLALVTAVLVFGLCACRTTDATNALNKTTHQTKGSSATTSLFAPTTPLCIKVTDREGRPLVGAELTYGWDLIDGEEDVTEEEVVFGVTDSSGTVIYGWVDDLSAFVTIWVAGADEAHSGVFRHVRITREVAQQGLTLSLKDSD